MNWKILNLPIVLSVNAGYVDTVGFLSLHGLFTSHVTGNFVTLAASLLHGTSGAVAKLMALPVFCLAIFAARLAHYRLGRLQSSALSIFLAVEIAALTIAALLAFKFGPFPDADLPMAFATGMSLVVAMALQNGLQRMHLSSAPPSTIMTGTTTQIMLDLADVVQGLPPEARQKLNPRLASMLLSVVAFALGCALAALFFALYGDGSLLLPPALTIAALLLHLSASR